MLYILLISIIIYLLYKEYKFSKKVAVLINSYLYLLKLGYSQDKKKTINNFSIFHKFLNNTHPVSDYNEVLTSLAEAWGTSAPKKDSIVDGNQAIRNIIKKLEYSINDPDFKESIE